MALSPAFDVAIVPEKKQLSASLFFVRQRHTAPHFVIATGAERGTSNSPGVSGVYPILFFRCVFFLGGFDVNNEIFHTALLFPDILGLVFRTCLCYSVLLPTWQFVWQGIPLARMEQEVKAPRF